MAPTSDWSGNVYTRYCQWDYVNLFNLRNYYSSYTSAVEIRIAGNPLSAIIDNIFYGLSSCRILYLAYNEIHTVHPLGFNHLAALENLYINNNMLNALLPGVFDTVPTLLQIYAQHNRLSSIPYGIFSSLSALTILDLSENQITALNNGFSIGLDSLTTLKLSGNNIQTLEAASLGYMPALGQIDLMDNSIEMIAWDVFVPENYTSSAAFPAPVEMKISGNPLVCNNNKMCWMKDAETDSSLGWWDGATYAPECTDIEWSAVSLSCASE